MSLAQVWQVDWGPVDREDRVNENSKDIYIFKSVIIDHQILSNFIVVNILSFEPRKTLSKVVFRW